MHIHWRNQGEANGQLPISFWALPIEIFFSKIYLLMNWIANIVFCLFGSHSHSHILVSFQYISTFSTFSAYCQIKNFSPSKKNLAHCLFFTYQKFAHRSKNPGCAIVSMYASWIVEFKFQIRHYWQLSISLQTVIVSSTLCWFSTNKLRVRSSFGPLRTIPIDSSFSIRWSLYRKSGYSERKTTRICIMGFLTYSYLFFLRTARLSIQRPSYRE